MFSLALWSVKFLLRINKTLSCALLQQEVKTLQRIPLRILKHAKAHPHILHVRTTSWGLLQHLWWPCLARESCRVPDRVCHLCSLLLACPILIYLHSSHLRTCHTCPRKWCPEDPCFLQIGSECQCPFLLVVLLSIDTLLWDQRAWMTEKGDISEMGGQGLGAHPSTEGGGRCWLDGPEWRVCCTTVRDTYIYQDIWLYKDCYEPFGVQKFVLILLYHQNLFLVSNKQWKTRRSVLNVTGAS